MAKNWNPSWASDVGVNNVPSYQVSGRPFAQNLTLGGTAKTQVKFEYVSRWVQITNHGTVDLKVAFSKRGFNESNYFILPAGNGSNATYHQTARLELKVSEIWLLGNSNNVSIVTGMTSIRPNKVSGSLGPSWSGSLGVS